MTLPKTIILCAFIPAIMATAACSLVSERWDAYWGKPEIPVAPVIPIERQNPDYIVSPGDQLDISVWKEEALTRVVAVLPDGKISFPLIGEMAVAGKTTAQIQEEMKGKLTPFVSVPIVSVEVKQVNSFLIYVIGRVNSPGRFILNTNINVLQALATAGGLNPFAKRNQIKIFRSEGGSTQIFPFRYDDVAKGIGTEQNIWLKRGDVIVVP